MSNMTFLVSIKTQLTKVREMKSFFSDFASVRPSRLSSRDHVFFLAEITLRIVYSRLIKI